MNTSEPSATGGAGATGDGRSARWDAHRQSRRTELVKAARSVIHRMGPSASMDDFAAAAGTSKSVFYRYFRDKDGLRQAMGEMAIGQMRAKVVDAARRATTEEAGLRAMVKAYLQMAQTSPNVYFFVTDTARDPFRPTPATTGDAPLDDFFAEITSMMKERMHAYLNGRHGAAGATSPALELWPTASIGMVRAAGEAWLRTAASPGKPDELELTQTITTWLVSGITGHPPGGTEQPRHPSNEATELERHTT
ncbi:MAG: TetR/AcrR family transcriptional regulator [Micrococcaceae bacterium]|uniref:TetR/AcrR family transcriptional regulator n=1 Tax=Arthrobacter sp. AOP36-A1-22 TaxID=3457684 RepID=UPI002651E88A|nr:TetR/AcrR family transcriptional regulator [Micrococcaceae bacterium]MDN6178491.1 TetR/AcrR family transcriptional regulator [Micrococcaceae bacterium]